VFAQSSKDINIVIQKTIDLDALNAHFTDSEKKGNTPIIILNDEKIPNNLIVFKFKKRVKLMTEVELESFKEMSKKNLDSYFIFDQINFTENSCAIKASFRENSKISIDVNLKKSNDEWKVIGFSVG
jgi:hypothetical protein